MPVRDCKAQGCLPSCLPQAASLELRQSSAEEGWGRGKSSWAWPAGLCFKRGLHHARLLSPAQMSPLLQSCGCCRQEPWAGNPPWAWASEESSTAEVLQALSPLQPARTGPPAPTFLVQTPPATCPGPAAPPVESFSWISFPPELREFATAQRHCSSASTLVAT